MDAYPTFDDEIDVERLVNARALLRETDDYAADPQILHRYQWIDQGKVSRLVRTADGSVGQLSLLTQIVSDECFLHPSKLWREDKRRRHLRDLNLRCIGVAPGLCDPDFEAALLNIKYFIGVGRRNNTYVDSVVNTPTIPEPGFIMTHRPFKDSDTTLVESDIRRMCESETVQPIAVFDMGGRGVPPSHYEEHLVGAVAAVRFTLAKTIKKRGQKVIEKFDADIVSMRIILAGAGSS